MSKQFAIVSGLSNIFNTQINDLGKTVYNISEIKSSVYTNFDINENTVFYIQTTDTDHNLGYSGNFIYAKNHLFSSYDNNGGQFVCTNIINSNENDTDAFLFGTITPLESYTPWSINYHIQSYSTDTTLNSEFDICLYGNNSNILNYYAYNANGENISYKYHIAKQNSANVQIGLCLYDTYNNNTEARNISLTITDYKNCKFTFNDLSTSTLDNCIIIDAERQGFVDNLNNDQLKIGNIHINQISGNQLKNHPKTLYGMDTNGNIAPLVSVNTVIPYSSQDNSRLYNTIGFDYTRGLYYSNNHDGSLAYVEGNIYSAFSGMDFRYFDNMAEGALNPSLPVYIKGTISNGLFYISPITTDAYTHCWTQTIDNENYVYWLVGYPQADGTLVNLFETNKLYKLVNGQIIEYININISKTIKFTPSGTVSQPTFTGTESTVSVSGQVAGTNAASAVTIVGSTISINNLTDAGTLPSLEYIDETVSLNTGTLPTYEAKTVWNGYTSATAAAQVFTGSTVTFTGTYTPAGTVSTPTFTGEEITITI